MAFIDYESFKKSIASLTDGEDDVIALMATVASELHHSDDRFDWTRFYRVTSPQMLKISPYRGGHGCLQISFNRGVCGAAARLEKTQLVVDVATFPGHIACSSLTRSEIVLPVRDRSGSLLAVLDIDSNQLNAFTQTDVDALVPILASVFSS